MSRLIRLPDGDWIDPAAVRSVRVVHDWGADAAPAAARTPAALLAPFAGPAPPVPPPGAPSVVLVTVGDERVAIACATRGQAEAVRDQLARQVIAAARPEPRP